MGQLHAAEESWQESIENYQRWLEFSAEEDDIVFRGLSYAHYQLEDFPAALPFWLSYMDLQQAQGEELGRDDYAYLNGLYFTLEDYESALENTKEMILKFNDPQDWRNLRSIYAELDEAMELDEALGSAETGAELLRTGQATTSATVIADAPALEE